MHGANLAGPSGRIDKRQAILDAAFTVFARDGYHLAGVDAIAGEAGVAKHTIYNHFGDKEGLFREAVAALSDQALTRNLAAVELLSGRGDLATLLTRTGLGLAECYCDERSEALRRLLHTQVSTMPDLLDIVRERATDRVYDALAAQLARLALAGKLKLDDDPAIAAEQFGALLTGPLENRSRLGTRKVSRPELRRVTKNAVATFLRAFANDRQDSPDTHQPQST
ncbi:TetR/AcrR family transcriptional regulator [Nocardia yamanashiensis]|uniref:TetR/AcrR family transcriptional regulator n=1 Tax=Nocardia yamanashiensis TaxID=209247 RepID=UPI001E4AC495|nr:TetR/AcrR family transcriptional regulator [Nocardia yamanashiensis]UGT44137.1 TetR/AcrR family transcriptional regulator [Nocardia yamanashiensis]